MQEIERQKILDSTRSWVDKFVIGLNLCPFAGKVAQEGKIRYRVCTDSGVEEMYLQFLSELSLLIDAEPEELETSLVVFPNAAADFGAFWDFAGLCEEGVVEAGLEGVVQVVAFHPGYRFEGEDEHAPSHFTNRSPYPTLHLLREASVAKVVAAHPDVDAIPARNVALLSEMGVEGIKKAMEKE